MALGGQLVAGEAAPPTNMVAQAMVAIAKLGGYLPQYKTPGRQSLGRDGHELQRMVEVYDMLSIGLPAM
jgi:hypothetical protein